MSAIASVVIPAHNEEATIASTLRALLHGLGEDELEVVVVCNGCTDDTARQAGAVDGVHVVELQQPSKVAALRAGDEHARMFPRVYLDADVELPGPAVRGLASALAGEEEARVAGVRATFDLSRSSRPVRWFYTFRQQLRAFDGGIIGAGVYALNEAGRARFGNWPEVIGDDQFVLRQFSEHERILVVEHQTLVRAPGGISAVVRRGVRVRRGNYELNTGLAGRASAPPTGVGQALIWAAPRPDRWVPAVTWLSVSVLIRLLARFGRAGDDWNPRHASLDPEGP